MNILLKQGVVLLICLSILNACSTPEEKKMQFYKKGQALYSAGNWVKARLEFKNAVQIDPNFVDGYYMLGQIELHDRNMQKAFEYFIKTESLAPDHQPTLVQLGKIYLGARKLGKCHEKVEKALTLDPDDEAALLLKASLMLARNETNEARVFLNDLKAKGITAPQLYLLLISTYSPQKDAAEIKSILNEGIDANPTATRLYTSLVKLDTLNQNFEESIRLLKKVISLNPDVPTHQFHLAAIYWDTGQKTAAKKCLDALRKKAPEKEEIIKHIARFYSQKKAYHETETLLREGITEFPQNFALRFYLSDLYLKMGQSQKAQAVLEDCLALDKDPTAPGVIETKNAMSALFLGKGLLAEARKWTDEVLQYKPSNVEAQFILGKIHLAKREGLDAVTAFRNVIHNTPQNIAAHIYLAEAHRMENEMELADDTLKSALRNTPTSKALLNARARLLTAQKDDAGAEESLRQIIAYHPKDQTARIHLGEFFVHHNALDKAEAVFTQMIAMAPDTPTGYLRLAEVKARQGDYQSAVNVVQGALKRFPAFKPILFTLIDYQIKNKAFDAALSKCNADIAQSPDQAFPYYLRGRVYAAQTKFKRAEESFLAAIQRDPLWPQPHTEIAQLYLRQGKEKEAIKKFTAAQVVSPKNASAYLALGTIYERKHDFDKAQTLYEEALTHLPNLWPAANNLALLYAEHPRGDADLKKALTLAEKANALNPNHMTTMDTLGWVHFKNGNLYRAEHIIRKALELSPDHPEVNYHLGMLLYQKGEQTEAIEKLALALKSTDPFYGRSQALATLKTLEAQSGGQ